MLLESCLESWCGAQLRLWLGHCAGRGVGGVAEARQDPEVTEDHSLAQQGRSVGRLDHLLGLGLLTLHLETDSERERDVTHCDPTFLFLMVWKCISHTRSTVSSVSNVTNPNPRCLLVCWSINMTASSTLPETRHQLQTNVSSQKSKQFLVREEKFGKKCVVADDILCDAITGRRISQFFLPL